MSMHPIELLHPRSLGLLSDSLQSLVRGRLWLQVVLGMVLGIGAGIALGPTAGWVSTETAKTLGAWMALPGRVFLGAIQMIVIPLVFASIIRGLAASEDVEQLKRVGLSAVAFFVVTTMIAVAIGIGVTMLVEPGRLVEIQSVGGGLAATGASAPPEGALASRSVPETIVHLIPTNPLGAMVSGEMLSVVIFAVVLGVALVSLPPAQAQPLLDLLGSLQQVSMTIVRWAMWLAPWAVFGLTAQLVAQLGLDALVGMGAYVATVLGAIAILLLFYLVLVAVLARRSPLRFLADVREVQLLAFSTSSSAAVMPLSIRTAEEKLGVRSSIAQFVIPLGATINMNGTALYQGAATVFLAQAYGLDLTLSQLGLVVATAVAASIGSPATPGVGIVILSMVLGAAGVPLEGIGLLMGVDRILDMSRTAANVTGDLLAVIVLDRFVGGRTTAAEQREQASALEARRSAERIDVVVDDGTQVAAPTR
jgi:Na+/H+-dicarboxylate symporter